MLYYTNTHLRRSQRPCPLPSTSFQDGCGCQPHRPATSCCVDKSSFATASLLTAAGFVAVAVALDIAVVVAIAIAIAIALVLQLKRMHLAKGLETMDLSPMDRTALFADFLSASA